LKALTPAASFTTSVGGSGAGSNVLNTKVTIGTPVAGNLVVDGSSTVTLFGGTEGNVPPGTPPARAGSTLFAGSILRIGSAISNSFDRQQLESITASNFGLYGPAIGSTVGPQWGPISDFLGGTNEPWSLPMDVTIPASWTFQGVTHNAPLQVTGPMRLATNSTIFSGSILNPGTIVTGSGDQGQINALAPTTTTNKFGIASASSAIYLANVGGYTFGAGSEVILNGDINLPATGSITIGGTPKADKTMLHECQLFGTSAAAILCIGTCSSFGGIPAATGNVTGAAGAIYKGYVKAGKFNGALNEFAAKTINIPGCPPHSDWIVGTIAYLLARSLQAFPPLEAYSRPIDYFGEYQCNAGPCEWRYNQGYKISEENSQYANPRGPLVTMPGELSGHGVPDRTGGITSINSSKLFKYKWANTANKRYVGCLGAVGCKGRKTKADCSLRRWNADATGKYGSGWCVSSGAGCHGCTEPTFPDKVGKFFNFA